MKILITDDNMEMASVIRDLLEFEGYQVAMAKNGDDGYLAYIDFKPDLVITDIHMPIKDGFEMMKKIRTHHPRMKAIYMSGDMNRFRSVLEEEKKRYQADSLEKPFGRNELISLVSRNLG